MLHRKRTVSALLACALVSAACGPGASDDPAAGAATITVGDSPTMSNASLHLVADEESASSDGLTVALETIQSGQAAVPLLLSGELQFTASDPVAAIVGVSKDLPVRIVAVGNVTASTAKRDATSLLVKGGSPIKDASDFAGRTIGINALGSISHIAAQQLIVAAGADPGAVRFVEIPIAQMVNAVERGQVDGVVTTEPFTTQGVESGLNRVAAPFSATMPGVPQLVYVATKDYIAENPETVAKFRDAIDKANATLAADPDKVREIGKTSTKTPAEVIDKIILPTFSDTGLDREPLERLIDLMIKYEILKAPVDLDDVIADAS